MRWLLLPVCFHVSCPRPASPVNFVHACSCLCRLPCQALIGLGSRPSASLPAFSSSLLRSHSLGDATSTDNREEKETIVFYMLSPSLVTPSKIKCQWGGKVSKPCLHPFETLFSSPPSPKRSVVPSSFLLGAEYMVGRDRHRKGSTERMW